MRLSHPLQPASTVATSVTPTKADSTVQGNNDNGMITTSFSTSKTAEAFTQRYAMASANLKACQLGVTTNKMMGYFIVCDSASTTKQRYVLLTQKALKDLGEPTEEVVVVGNTTNKARVDRPLASAT